MDGRRLNRKVGRFAKISLIAGAGIILLLAGCANPLSEIVRDEVSYARAAEHSLQIESAAGADVSPVGTIQVKDGYASTVKVLPYSGYQFVEWQLVSAAAGVGLSFDDSSSASVEVTLSGGDATIRPVVRRVFEIVSHEPESDVNDFSINNQITLTFTQDVVESAVAGRFSLYDETDDQGVSGTINVSGSSIFFTPDSDLQSFHTYTASVSSGIEDIYGDTLEAGYSWSFSTSDGTAPYNGSIVINSGDEYTGSTNVALALSAQDDGNVSQIRISNSSDFVDSGWEPYTTSDSWSIPTGDGLKTVFVWFKDEAGNISDRYSDSIHLDTDLPSAGIQIDSGAEYTDSISVTLVLSSDEAGTTAADMQVQTTATLDPNGWESYSSSKGYTLPAGDGTKTLFFWTRDKAGNVSSRASDSIILDTDPPAVSSITPTNNAVNIPVDASIEILFDEPMDSGTISSSTVRLRYTGGTYVGTSVSYNSATRTVTIDPIYLRYNQVSYTVEITTGASDVAGNSLPSIVTSRFFTKDKEASITFLDSIYLSNPYFQDFVVAGDEAFVISRNISGSNYGRLYRINMSSRSNISSTEYRDIRNEPEKIIADSSYVYIGHGSQTIRKVEMQDFSNIDDESSVYTSGVIGWSGNNRILKVYNDDLIGISPSNLSTGVEVSNEYNLQDAVTMLTIGSNTFVGEVFYDMEPVNTLQSFYTGNTGSQGATYLRDTQNITSDLSVGADISSLDVYDGEYLVVGNRGSNGLALYDITDPDNILYDRSVYISGVEDVSVWDQYAAVARGNNGIAFVDLGSPAHEVLVSAQLPANGGGEVHDIYFDGTYIYILKGSSGSSMNYFQVYQVDIY